MLTGTDQSGAAAGGDVVGRDKKVTVIQLPPSGVVGKLEALKACLEEEMSNNKTVQEFVESEVDPGFRTSGLIGARVPSC
jgi:hypothetical protein